MLRRSVTTALLAALFAGTASASPDGDERYEYYERRGPMPFEVMDLNGDGVISAAEHEQVRAARQQVRAAHGYPMRRAASAPKFEEIDLNDNGSIDPDELTAWRAQRWQQRSPGCGGRWRS